MLHDDESVLRLPTSTGLVLELERTDPYGRDDPYVGGMLVRAAGDHVRVEQQVIVSRGKDLAGFFRGMYDDVHGWTGERAWRSLEHELQITARHDGHVHLRWELAHTPYGQHTWSFAVTTHHDAGEDMRRLADAFEQLLD